MGDLGFGAPFNMLQSGKAHWAIKLLNEGMDPAGFNFPAWFFRTVIAIPGLASGYFKFIAFCNQQIADRMEKQGKQEVQDVTHYLVDNFEKSGKPKEGIPLIQADSRLIIVAGSDTTAATLAHLFYHIAADPSIAQKLREELKPRLGEDGKITHQHVSDAPFLNGCINEALRLNPPVPSGVFRLTPKEGVNIGEQFIPGDTTIQMPGYVIGHGTSLVPVGRCLFSTTNLCHQTTPSTHARTNSSPNAGQIARISFKTKTHSNLSPAAHSVALEKISPFWNYDFSHPNSSHYSTSASRQARPASNCWRRAQIILLWD